MGSKLAVRCALVAGLSCASVGLTAGPADAAYSPSAAVAYADRYATQYNTSAGWPVFSSDCTNFVSQAMLAGGHHFTGTPRVGVVTTNKEWWTLKDGSGNYSHRATSWSVAEHSHYFEAFVDVYSGVARDQTYTAVPAPYTPSDIKAGDPIWYNWDANSTTNYDHAAIQVGIGYDSIYPDWYGNLVDEHSVPGEVGKKRVIWNLFPHNSAYAYTSFSEVHING
ncbi:MAG: hypothetical protein JWM93_520 [Frankiales bacterium]|nr:hypothetical protein [Frankiales bacterium]